MCPKNFILMHLVLIVSSPNLFVILVVSITFAPSLMRFDFTLAGSIDVGMPFITPRQLRPGLFCALLHFIGQLSLSSINFSILEDLVYLLLLEYAILFWFLLFGIYKCLWIFYLIGCYLVDGEVWLYLRSVLWIWIC